MNLLTLFFIFALLITADKALTMANVIQVNKNFPDAMKDDYFKIEKNPVAKHFFEKFGLWGGTIAYWFLSMITIFLAFYILSFVFQDRVALYILMMAYGFVIMNNFYFLLKYSRVFL